MKPLSRLSPSRTKPPVVVCIAERAEERGRLAEMFDGVGVLVIASDTESATRFLRDREDRTNEEPIRLGGLRIDLAQHEASWDGVPLPLTTHEFAVLVCLVDPPRRMWTYRQLHDRAWEDAYLTGPAAVQSVIKRLRRKLRAANASLSVEAVRGLGFRLITGHDLDAGAADHQSQLLHPPWAGSSR
ncbi:MAG: winged helix-turn-helix domain-containing protein [Nocardioides sp.]